ncbi:MAG TPA: phosphatase PAP2/dual specificity phosphatase family protein [Burkholderiaceae bacterium]|nr:phosphatase PAP2/dual specificity phosphatase family protein [Burkholderiaceae bacterium]
MTPIKRPWKRAAVWLALLAPFFYLTYGTANYVASLRSNVGSIVFDWERHVPFVAWTIYPYWSINVFYGLSLFLCRSDHELTRHVLRLVTAQIVAVICFIVFPLAFSFGQPAADGVGAWLFEALRGFDRPFNQAPSLHIALAVILWDFYRRLTTQAFTRWALHLWTLLVIGSVLTTYQHHFIDIPTGTLLGVLCVWLWPLERTSTPFAAARPARDPQRIKLASIYLLAAVAVFIFAIAVGDAALWLCWPAVALFMVALNYALLGERGFQKTGNGRMSWAAQVLYAPYRLGAWLNSRWWTRHHPHDSQVAPRVWLGRLPGHGDEMRMRRLSIVDLTAELQTPRSLASRAEPALDLLVPAPRLLRRAARTIERFERDHSTVLVCCALGYSRSAAAVATWLLVSGHARTVDDAVALIRKARPDVVLRESHLQAIAAAARVTPASPA